MSLEIDWCLLDDLCDEFYEEYLIKKQSGFDFERERLTYLGLQDLFFKNIKLSDYDKAI